MTATATYTSATKQLAVTGDGLPDPVSYGTFPNLNNPNAVTEQAFAHTFRYRGGEFGVERTFDDNTYFQSGFVISVNISCLLYTSPSPRDKRQSRMPSSA